MGISFHPKEVQLYNYNQVRECHCAGSLRLKLSRSGWLGMMNCRNPMPNSFATGNRAATPSQQNHPNQLSNQPTPKQPTHQPTYLLTYLATNQSSNLSALSGRWKRGCLAVAYPEDRALGRRAFGGGRPRARRGRRHSCDLLKMAGRVVDQWWMDDYVDEWIWMDDGWLWCLIDVEWWCVDNQLMIFW